MALRHLLVIGLLALAIPAAADSGVRPPVTKPAVRSNVIHPRLASGTGLSNPPDRVWVRFADRGSAAGKFVPLSSRALQRRVKRGVSLDTDDRQPVAAEYIDAVRRSGARIHRVSRWLNAVSVDYQPDLLAPLASLPEVAQILPVARFVRDPHIGVEREYSAAPVPSASLNYGPSTAQIQQINVHLAHDRGYTGAGVLVAMFDTGFRKDHDAFAAALVDSRLVAEWDFVFDDGDVQNEPEDDPGAHSHGTSTWSVLGGAAAGQLYGPAYGASFVLAKTEDIRSETPVEEDNWMAAMEWADSIGADVISSSLTYSDWYALSDYDGITPITTQAANLAATLGIVVCNSAGNGGPGARTIGAPVDGFYLLSVGSVTSTGAISGFSSRGPTEDGRIKPEVCARGSSDAVASSAGTNTYGASSGTSFSCPLVGGCAALLLEAHPTWNPLMVREALMQTASDPSTPDNTFGWGIVNVNAALDYEGSIAASVAAPPDVLVSYETTHDVEITAGSLSPVNLSSSSLYYREEGQPGFNGVPLVPGSLLGAALSAPYKATLPAPSNYLTTYEYYVVIQDSVGFTRRLPDDLDSTFTLVWQTLLVGDMNRNTTVESADIILLVNYVFKSGPAPDPIAVGEINGLPPIASGDIIHLVNYVFKGGLPPVFP